MRRTTEFENPFIKSIYNSKHKGITFNELTEMLNSKDIDFEAYSNNNKWILKCLGQKFDDNTGHLRPEQKDYIERTSIKLSEIIDVKNLIKLLLRNEFIYTSKSYVFYVNTRRVLGQNNLEPFDRYSSVYATISEEDFDIFFRYVFHPTQALKVYINDNFRTEEQKKYDEDIKQYKINNLQTDASLVLAGEGVNVAAHSAKAAFYAIGFSVLFSFFTILYTYLHDKSRDKIEDDRYKEDAIAEAKQAKKDSLIEIKTTSLKMN